MARRMDVVHAVPLVPALPDWTPGEDTPCKSLTNASLVF